jgi:hypothetical protein
VDLAKEDEMGSLIPIGGGADAEIKSRLNAAFNDKNIIIVRGQDAKENLFNGQGNHHLHRLAYRLGAYPIGTYTGESARAKGKWFYFLKHTLRGPAIRSIITILSYAMTYTDTVARVVFDARPGDPKVDHYVAGPTPNPTDDDDIAQLVDSSGTLLLVLICPDSLSMNTIAVPDQPGDADTGEQPPIRIFTPSVLTPPVLDKKTRKPREKAVGRAKKTKAKKGSRK